MLRLQTKFARLASSSNVKSIHSEEILNVAREWPHEFYDPSHFEEPQPKESKTTPEMLALIATSHEEPEPARFSSQFWTRILFFGVVGTAFYRWNEYYAEKNTTHPLTKYLAPLVAKYDGFKTYIEEAKSIPVRQEIANDQLILQSKNQFAPSMKRNAFPGSLERASDFLIPVGSQVNVENLNYKYSYQETDKYFGVPYPKSE